MPSPLVPIGAVVRAHGVRGWVRVRPFHVASEALGSARRLFVAGQERRVEQASRERQEWLVKLAGVGDRDAAEALQGSEVALPRDELPAAADDEVYIADLVGCTLVDPDGRLLGTVRAVENYGMQELLIIDAPGAGGEAMLPFVEPLVLSVDLAARRIVCDPPEGLFELAAATSGRPELVDGEQDDADDAGDGGDGGDEVPRGDGEGGTGGSGAGERPGP